MGTSGFYTESTVLVCRLVGNESQRSGSDPPLRSRRWDSIPVQQYVISIFLIGFVFKRKRRDAAVLFAFDADINRSRFITYQIKFL